MAEQGRADDAMREYRNLIILARDISRRGSPTVTEDYELALAGARSDEAGKVREEADAFYLDENYSEALTRYLKVNSLKPSDELPELITDCAYHVAEALLAGQRQREAIRNYELALEFSPGYQDAAQKKVHARFQLVECFLLRGLLRHAHQECERLAAADPAAIPDENVFEGASGRPRTARQWADFVKEKATSRLVITSFAPQAGVEQIIGGRDIPSAIQDRVYSKIAAKASPYLKLLREGSAARALEAIQQSRVNEARAVTSRGVEFEVYDYWLEGALNSVAVHRPDPNIQNLQGYVTLMTYEQRIDPQTNMPLMVITGSVNHPYTYTLVEKSLEVSVSTGYRINDVSGAATLSADSVSARESDAVRYVENLTMAPPPANTFMSQQDAFNMIPADIRQLQNARKNLKSEGELLDAILETTCLMISQAILDQLDVMPPATGATEEPCQGL